MTIIKTAFVRVCLLLCLVLTGTMKPQSAVTYLDKQQWGGRLGDMLIMYTKAKWLAFSYKLPLLYKPFVYSDELEMHYQEMHFSRETQIGSKKRIICRDAPATLDGYIIPDSDTLYTVHYYFNLPQWGEYQTKYDSQEIMAWSDVYNNQEFLDELKKNIAPHDTIELDDLPTGRITVAVHVRTGGGFDHPILSRQLYALADLNPNEPVPVGTYADKYWPLKFPPLQYYIDQIKLVSEMYNDMPIYLYIYTDDANPVIIMEAIEKSVQKNNIVFDCRRVNNHHSDNVLKDMFAMAKYDCLIRSGSNYPQISQLIGNHSTVIYPKSCVWIGTSLVIDEVGVYIRK